MIVEGNTSWQFWIDGVMAIVTESSCGEIESCYIVGIEYDPNSTD